jgi:protease-4
MTAKPSFLKRIGLFVWNTVNGIRKLILNLIFFGILAAIFVAFMSDEAIVIEDNTALVLNLSGTIVDQKRFVDPIEAALNQGNEDNPNAEILLADVLYVINNATHDKRINTLVLDVASLHSASVSKMTAIGEALNDFKAADKTVIAHGNYFNQNQYFLASYASKIYLNTQGMVSLDGLSRYRMYYKSALEKLKINTHVFRVGTFKSAVEPFIRDDMSDADKASSNALLADIWSSYSEIVSKNRDIEPADLVLPPERYLTLLDEVAGDSAKMALNMKWVDELVSEEEFRLLMLDTIGEGITGAAAVGANMHQYRQVQFNDYLALVKPMPSNVEKDAVGILVAKGTILNGHQQAGDIGGESTAELLRKARFNDNIKALVLRVDSPGGSAFASEQIRQEILALKSAGKPVVVSMGSMAASGGYWISASSDYIYATPTTLTGSIGIFGMFATFEDALSHIGVTTDGVATSQWAGLTVTRPLNDKVAAVIQRHIERGYHEFITLVAKERDMTLEQVDTIAQGRVWTGKKALELGLVDELGDMEDAIAKAAELAKMDHFDTKLIEQELTPEQLFVQQVIGASAAYIPSSMQQSSLIEKVLTQWASVIEEFNAFDDPNGVYLYCDQCNY